MCPPDLAGRPIALLVNILSSGGAQRRIATLANGIAALGHAVDVVSFERDGPMRALLEPGVRVVALARSGLARPFSTLADAQRLRAYVRRAQPAVLMSCVTDTHGIAVLGHGDAPLVLRASRHPHRAVEAGRWRKQVGERIKRARAGWCYRRADAVVALSEQAAEVLRGMIGGQGVPVVTIHNPVVEQTWLDDPTPRPANDPPLILGIGRFTRQKDFGTLLRAFALLRAERPARLRLLGEGPDRGALEALAAQLGIKDDVEMPGEVRTIDACLRRADLLVSSSLWEGMQATLIEALAAGCPVVATDCPGGAGEVLEEGRLGELVPVSDPDAMAAAMARQLDRTHDPAELARGATQFLFDGKTELYLSLFAQI